MYLITEIYDDFSKGFNEFTEKYFWRIVVSIAVIALFFVLKNAISALTAKIIKNTVKKSKNGDAEKAEALKMAIVPAVKVLVMTAAITLCIPILSPEAEFKALLNRVAISLFLISAFTLLYGFSSYAKYSLEKKYRDAGKEDSSLAVNFTVMLLKVAIITIGALTVLQQWVTNISSLLAGLSIGGVALALAAQDTASNLFGAVTVMFDKPFDADDYIEVAGEAGTVEKMGMRSTVLRRKDRSVVCIPNSKMASENIVNWSRTDSRRVDMTLSLMSSIDRKTLETFMEGIRLILESEKGVQKENILVALDAFAESSLDISVRYFTDSKGYDGMMEVKNSVNLKIMRLAETMKVEFAYPTRKIYVTNDEKEN